MKKLILLLAVVSSVSWADCFENLSKGRDSASHQIQDVVLTSKHDSARHALSTLLKQSGCVNVQVNVFRCSEIARGIKESFACYAKTDVGYFIINKDYLENVNITFNRFD